VSDETPQAAEPDEGDNASIGSWVIEILKTWGPAILAIIIIRTFVFQLFNIPSTSMVPTLLIGDHVLVTKYSYGLWVPNPLGYERWEALRWGAPKRGDVIVFRYPRNKAIHYIKRVVAIPGDRIEVRDNQIAINGTLQERDLTGQYQYDDQDCRQPRTANLWNEHLANASHPKLTDLSYSGALANYPPTTVPPGKVFVMGDNRDHSGDSREWSFVDEELIMGKAHFIVVSFDHCGGTFPPTFRWDRLGLGLYNGVEPNVTR
jgi:signal peptidase I